MLFATGMGPANIGGVGVGGQRVGDGSRGASSSGNPGMFHNVEKALGTLLSSKSPCQTGIEV